MTTPVDSFEAGRLAANARVHRYDPVLDPIADAIDRGDTAAWRQVPVERLGRAVIYADFRRYHRQAVEAGVIADDRSGPSAAR